VLEIGTGICDPGVQLRDVPPVLARTLRLCQFFGRASTEPVVGQFFSGGQCSKVLQTQVDANTRADRTRGKI
jgi:hypothetical protein